MKIERGIEITQLIRWISDSSLPRCCRRPVTVELGLPRIEEGKLMEVDLYAAFAEVCIGLINRAVHAVFGPYSRQNLSFPIIQHFKVHGPEAEIRC